MSDIYGPDDFCEPVSLDGDDALTGDEALYYVESETPEVDDRGQYYLDLKEDLKDPAFQTAYVEEALAQEAKDYEWFYKDLRDRVGEAFAEAFEPSQSEKLDQLKVLWPNIGYTSVQELIDREKPLRDSTNKWSQIHANHWADAFANVPAKVMNPDLNNEEVRTLLGFTTKDSGEHKEFAGGGRRDSQAGKPRFDLLVPETVPYEHQFLTRFAALMGRGAEKYEDRNWELFDDQEALDRAKASAYRHFMQWFTGETDEDHGAATAFNIMAVDYVQGILDGRWPAREES